MKHCNLVIIILLLSCSIEHSLKNSESSSSSSSSTYSCPTCQHVFRQAFNLTVHVREQHTNQRYYCPVCNRSFTRYFNLVVHHNNIKDSLHRKEEKLPNQQRDLPNSLRRKIFKTNNYYNRLTSIPIVLERSCCPHCKKRSFGDVKALREHLSFCIKQNQKASFQSVIRNPQTRIWIKKTTSLTTSKKNHFICPQNSCQQEFDLKKKLTRHIKITHPTQQELLIAQITQ